MNVCIEITFIIMTPILPLTRKPHPQLIHSVSAHTFLIGKIHRVGKNPERVRPIMLFFSTYDHFTEFSAYCSIL